MPTLKFKKGNPGKPKGAKNKTTFLKEFICESFIRNKEKAITLIDEMYNDKKDFQWLMELQASLEPKEVRNENNNTEKKIIVEITKGSNATPRLSGKILQEQ